MNIYNPDTSNIFEGLMVVDTKINLLGCSLVDTQQQFGVMYCLHFQCVLSICWYLHTRLYIISHNITAPIRIIICALYMSPDTKFCWKLGKYFWT